MANLRDGFDGRVPQTQGDVQVALETGLLSLDANVLLNFYRYTPAARQALADVIVAAGDRVFVSHQSAREFWRNRHHAIDDRNGALGDLLGAINKAREAIDQSLNAWAKRSGVATDTLTEVREKFTATISGLVATIEEQGGEGTQASYDVTNDEIAKILEMLLRGRVGDPLPSAEYEEALAEGARRAEAGLPPGFKDVAKGQNDIEEGAAGDYIVWAQSLREAAARAVPLVIVTGDEKDDWWLKHRTTFFGPREELVAECRDQAKVALYMLRPIQLIENSSLLGIEVAAEVRGDVARTSPTRGGWTSRAVYLVLDALRAEGAVQERVIRRAAELGGEISRSEIFDLCGFEPDRMLRGFTRPVRRVTTQLQAAGLIPDDVEDLLAPVYVNVIAESFRVPSEAVAVLAADDE